jgi:hypothetical protein
MFRELLLSGTHHVLVYPDGMPLFGDNISTIKKNTEALTNASNEVGLEVNTNKTKYMLMSSHQNAGQNHNILEYSNHATSICKAIVPVLNYHISRLTVAKLLTPKISRPHYCKASHSTDRKPHCCRHIHCPELSISLLQSQSPYTSQSVTVAKRITQQISGPHS